MYTKGMAQAFPFFCCVCLAGLFGVFDGGVPLLVVGLGTTGAFYGVFICSG